MEYLTKSEIKIELNKAFDETIAYLNLHSEEVLNQEIITGRWTIAQHVFHLVKTTKAVSKGMRMPKLAMRTMFGKNNRTERTYSELETKYKKTLAEKNVKAPAEFSAEPGQIFTKETLLQRFSDEFKDIQAALDKWNEKDLSVYIMPHPAIGKLSIREFGYFTILHTRHHLDILKEQYGY